MDDATPEAIESPDVILQSMILDVNGVLEAIPGKEDRGYLDHAIRVREIIEASEFGKNEGLLLAAGIHDAVAYALDNDNDASKAIWEALAHSLEALPDQRDTVRYAIGISLSAHEWEDRAEIWRYSVGSDLKKIADDQELDDHAQQTRRYLAERYADKELPEIADVIHMAITDSATTEISEAVRGFNVGITDAGQMLRDLKVNDIEGLILKAAESEDNIQFPNTNRPASLWQDIIESINYLVPALEFAGLGQHANDIRDGALYKLHLEDELMPEAEQSTYEAAVLKPDIDFLVTQATDIQGGFKLKGERFKSPGSRLESIRNHGHVPADSIGYRYVTDDASDDDVVAKAKTLQSILASEGFTIYHPRGEDQAFESFIGDNRRMTGYEAIHMTFRYTGHDFHDIGTGINANTVDDEGEISTTVEIQIMTESGYVNNETRASHTLYKTIGGADDIAQAITRQAQGCATEYDIELIEDCVGGIEHMRERKEYLIERKSSTILQTHTLSKLARIDKLHDADPLLQVIRKMDVAGKPDTVISPTVVSPELFEQLSKQLMPSLWEDDEFQSYYKLAKYVHEHQPRNDKVTDHFEGHILPATIALMYKMALTSEFNDQINFKEWILLSLWHDILEDFKKYQLKNDPHALKLIQDELDTMPEGRRQSLHRLTKPDKKLFQSSQKREEKSIAQLEIDEEIVKIFERMNNLRTDLDQFDVAAENGSLTQDFINEMTRYYHKSVYVLRIMERIGIMKDEKDWFEEQYRKRGILPLN